MQRVSEQISDANNISCDKALRAFNTIKNKGMKPYVYNGGVAGELIRVHVKNRYYSFNPRTKKYVRTDMSGKMKWIESKGVVDFINQALDKANGKEPKSTEKQKSYIASMLSRLDLKLDSRSYNTVSKACLVISDLKGQIGKSNDTVHDKKLTHQLEMNPYDPSEPRTQKVNGKTKAHKTIGLQFNRYEWWALEQAVKKSKRSVNSIIREGIKKELEATVKSSIKSA